LSQKCIKLLKIGTDCPSLVLGTFSHKNWGNLVLGTDRLGDGLSGGRVVQGTERPGFASSKERIIQGTDRPDEGSSRGRIVTKIEGMFCHGDGSFGDGLSWYPKIVKLF
jgi:hypothetical protein